MIGRVESLIQSISGSASYGTHGSPEGSAALPYDVRVASGPPDDRKARSARLLQLLDELGEAEVAKRVMPREAEMLRRFAREGATGVAKLLWINPRTVETMWVSWMLSRLTGPEEGQTSEAPADA
jgi:hypothetical protein